MTALPDPECREDLLLCGRPNRLTGISTPDGTRAPPQTGWMNSSGNSSNKHRGYLGITGYSVTHRRSGYHRAALVTGYLEPSQMRRRLT